VENLVGWAKGSFFKQRRFWDEEDLRPVIVNSNDPGVVRLVTHPLRSLLPSIMDADLSTRGSRRASCLAGVCSS
jgi:hypothetical protein